MGNAREKRFLYGGFSWKFFALKNKSATERFLGKEGLGVFLVQVSSCCRISLSAPISIGRNTSSSSQEEPRFFWLIFFYRSLNNFY